MPIRSVPQFSGICTKANLSSLKVKAFDGGSSVSFGTKHHEMRRKIKSFWLFGSCAMTLTIVPELRTDKVVIVPLHNGVEKGDVGGRPTADPSIDASGR